jgi:uncharacterized protein (DUF885 family)
MSFSVVQLWNVDADRSQARISGRYKHRLLHDCDAFHSGPSALQQNAVFAPIRLTMKSHAHLLSCHCMTWARALLCGVSVSILAAFVPAARASQADADHTKALHALFDRAWEWSAVEFPEFATYRGDLRFNDRLADASAEAQARRDREAASFLAQARAIPRDKLSPTDRVSLDMFIDNQQRSVDMAAFPAARGMSLRVLGGPQSQFADLLQVMPVARAEQVEQMLSRMAAFPRRMDQEIDSLRRSAAGGWVPAQGVLQRVLAQIDSQLAGDAASTPYYQPFTRLGREIPAVQQAALQQRGLQAVQQQVLPALRKLRALVAGELMSKAPLEGALRVYPQGEAVYAMNVRQQTTTSMTPAEIHAVGKRELTRLRGEMEA